MLETTLLKVKHDGEINAKCLFPYIERAHVYSPESCFTTEEDAVECELFWEEKLLSEEKKVNSLKELSEATENYEFGSFALEEHKYLLERGIPLWHLERFSKEKATELEARFEEAESSLSKAFTRLSEGKLDLYLELADCYFKGIVDHIIVRDQEIARNLRDAEERIRKRYPSLENNDLLQLVTAIGSLHSPEEFIPDVKVVILNSMDYEATLVSNYKKSIKQGEAFANRIPTILKFGLSNLSLSPNEIEEFADSELYAVLGSYAR